MIDDSPQAVVIIPPNPSKIVCIGRSFRKHALELGHSVPTMPIYFLKAPSAVIGPGEAILRPPESSEVHHEAEVAVVIGQTMRRVGPAEAMEGIASWTILNDVTARDLQRADKGRFTRAKGFDTFCPLSDVRLSLLDWRSCRIQCRVDNELRQDGALSDLLFSPGEMLAHISAGMTLLPGDIVSFGTPEGVGPIQSGQTVEIRLVGRDGETLATLSNPVR